jgi:tRNA(Glu) U13 pseudouridine synthase TruD
VLVKSEEPDIKLECIGDELMDTEEEKKDVMKEDLKHEDVKLEHVMCKENMKIH